MRDFDENNITDAVLESFARTPDARLKQIVSRLTHHLHAFVRDVEPTFDEWLAAIQFLTRTGQMCSPTRQEFILLSDTFGVSMLVDAINHRLPEGATETTVLGPFYVDNAPEFALGADISAGMEGQPLYAEGTIAAADGAPLAGATVDVWQSDDDGFYDVQAPDPSKLSLRGRFKTDAEGRYRFWSIVPAFYPIPNDGPVGEMLVATGRHPFRPAHVHFMIRAPGCETLVTHVFVPGDRYLDSDAVFGVKNSLVGDFIEKSAGTKAPDGRAMSVPWRHLTYNFGLKRAAAPARAA
jgi:hydroxyquinol 1,2-dioxygenase